jgi:hypothetical protein
MRTGTNIILASPQRWIFLAVVFGLLVNVSATRAASPASDRQSEFTIKRGGAEPICSEYIQQLEKMPTRYMLNCGRSEPRDAPQFVPLHRVRLSTDALYAISEQLFGFAEHSDTNYYDNWRKSRIEFCKLASHEKACTLILDERAKAEARGGRWGETYSRDYVSGVEAWKYEPGVDIDNNGTADAVLVLRRQACGDEDYKGALQTSPTYAFVMDASYLHVDIAKTRLVFGHPDPKWPSGMQTERFRYVGDEMGILSFGGETYFDTFFTSVGDFEGKRTHDVSLSSTLGVFLHKHGVTKQVCEIRWQRPEYRNSNSKSIPNQK